jgi:hypothetical protein
MATDKTDQWEDFYSRLNVAEEVGLLNQDEVLTIMQSISCAYGDDMLWRQFPFCKTVRNMLRTWFRE